MARLPSNGPSGPSPAFVERITLASSVVASESGRWETELRRIPRKSKLADAIRYGIRRRAAFERFLERVDVVVEPETASCGACGSMSGSRSQNLLFAGSDGGGRTWAILATLLATAKLNNVDPHAWLKLTLERIANGWPNRELDALMPWNYRPA